MKTSRKFSARPSEFVGAKKPKRKFDPFSGQSSIFRGDKQQEEPLFILKKKLFVNNEMVPPTAVHASVVAFDYSQVFSFQNLFSKKLGS